MASSWPRSKRLCASTTPTARRSTRCSRRRSGSSKPAPEPIRLHLDADASIKALHRALIERGHDVTRTPAPWIAADASDETQLLVATARGRCIFTFNVRDFMLLAQRFPEHGGILLAAQRRWTLPGLIGSLDRFLARRRRQPIAGRVHWLEAWR